MTLLLVLVTCFSYAQVEVIPWSADVKLNWNDFKGTYFKTAWAAAVTASGISYDFTYENDNGEMKLDIAIGAYFYPSKSWYNPKVCDANILKHEQLHFDISELYAQKMKKRVYASNFTKNVKTEIKVIYKQILKELNNYQKAYDHKTNYSRDIEKQLLWEAKVAKALMDDSPLVNP